MGFFGEVLGRMTKPQQDAWLGSATKNRPESRARQTTVQPTVSSGGDSLLSSMENWAKKRVAESGPFKLPSFSLVSSAQAAEAPVTPPPRPETSPVWQEAERKPSSGLLKRSLSTSSTQTNPNDGNFFGKAWKETKGIAKMLPESADLSWDITKNYFSESNPPRVDRILKNSTGHSVPIPEKKPKWIGAPIVNKDNDREKAILNNDGAKFEIVRSSNSSVTDPWFSHELIEARDTAAGIVQKYDDIIKKYSAENDIDPDLVRAIMFAENAVGHKGGFNEKADKERVSTSPLPMNVDKNRWAKLVDRNSEDLYDPETNIKAAVKLIKRIHERIEDPTPAKVGSVWQFSGNEKTNEFGEYIGRVYKDRRWKLKN